MGDGATNNRRSVRHGLMDFTLASRRRQMCGSCACMPSSGMSHPVQPSLFKSGNQVQIRKRPDVRVIVGLSIQDNFAALD